MCDCQANKSHKCTTGCKQQLSTPCTVLAAWGCTFTHQLPLWMQGRAVTAPILCPWPGHRLWMSRLAEAAAPSAAREPLQRPPYSSCGTEHLPLWAQRPGISMSLSVSVQIRHKATTQTLPRKGAGFCFGFPFLYDYICSVKKQGAAVALAQPLVYICSFKHTT